jgi:hypothetical protein
MWTGGESEGGEGAGVKVKSTWALELDGESGYAAGLGNLKPLRDVDRLGVEASAGRVHAKIAAALGSGGRGRGKDQEYEDDRPRLPW